MWSFGVQTQNNPQFLGTKALKKKKKKKKKQKKKKKKKKK